MNTTLSAVFDQTISVLNDGGWVQNYRYSNGAYCLAGALQKVSQELDKSDCDLLYIAARKQLIAAIPATEISPGLELVTWNDRPERTKDQVIALLTECRDKAIAEEALVCTEDA